MSPGQPSWVQLPVPRSCLADLTGAIGSCRVNKALHCGRRQDVTGVRRGEGKVWAVVTEQNRTQRGSLPWAGKTGQQQGARDMEGTETNPCQGGEAPGGHLQDGAHFARCSRLSQEVMAEESGASASFQRQRRRQGNKGNKEREKGRRRGKREPGQGLTSSQLLENPRMEGMPTPLGALSLSPATPEWYMGKLWV